MPDFDPDAFLAKGTPAKGFDPDAFVNQIAPLRQAADIMGSGKLDRERVALQSMTPGEKEIAAQRNEVQLRKNERAARENFKRRNAEPGFDLDLDSELPASTRASLSFEGNIDKQVEKLGKDPSVLAVRKSKDGTNVIARVVGDDGRAKDILLHPKNPLLTAGDFAGATAPLLKTAALAGAGVATGGMALLPQALTMGATAGGLEALSSGGSRVLAGQNIDPSELAGSAGKEAAINAGLPLAGYAGKRGLEFAGKALRGGAGVLESKLPEAAKRLGVDTTVAETTGSPLLAKLGKLTPEEDAARQGALRAAKDRGITTSTGKPNPLASEADVADAVQPIFAKDAETAQSLVRSGMTNAEKAANAQIQADLDRGIVPANKSTSDVGNFIREKIAGKAAGSKTADLRAGAEKLYGEANALADAENVVVAPTNVSKLASELDADTHKALLDFAPGIKKIPQLESLLTKDKVIDTGLVDAAGRAVTRVEPAPPLTIPQARELRSVVYEMAHAPGPPGEGGVPRRYLSQLYKALDEDLNAAVSSGSPELQKAHEAADAFYKSKIQPLQQSDVSKLFLESDAAGRMGGDEIVRRLFTGNGNLDALRAYRTVLGKDSPEWKLLVRQGLQTVIEDAGARNGTIDAGKFLTRLDQLSKTELADEIIGPVAGELRNNATLMARAQGVKIPEDELIDALHASPKNVSSLLEAAIKREESVDRTYNSSVQKQLRDGVLGPRTLGSADDFVTRFIEGKNTSIEDVRQALTQIGAKSPQSLAELRQTALQNVVENARLKGALGKVTTGETEDLNHEFLKKATTGDDAAKLRAVLGDKGMQFLDDLATYAEATSKRKGAEVIPETTVIQKAARVAGGGTIGALTGYGTPAIVGGALAGLSADAGKAIARKIGSIAVRNPSVINFIETGALPTLSPTAQGMILAAPQAIRTRNAVLAEKP